MELSKIQYLKGSYNTSISIPNKSGEKCDMALIHEFRVL